MSRKPTRASAIGDPHYHAVAAHTGGHGDAARVVMTFRFSGQDWTLSGDEARWLLGQVRTAHELTPAAAAVAAKIEQGLEKTAAVETTLMERRELVEALERGSTRPRSHELRSLEIGLHTAVYTETYLEEQ